MRVTPAPFFGGIAIFFFALAYKTYPDWPSAIVLCLCGVAMWHMAWRD